MKTYFEGWKHVYKGRQDEVASVVCKMLWGYSNKASVNAMTDFIRLQRAWNNGNLIVWRGVGIDTRARACRCWIEDLQTVNQFRSSVGVAPIG